jgi:hypothetical protein
MQVALHRGEETPHGTASAGLERVLRGCLIVSWGMVPFTVKRRVPLQASSYTCGPTAEVPWRAGPQFVLVNGGWV